MTDPAPTSPPVRGLVEAAGFVVDVGLLGEAEARRRVVAAWQPGSGLRLLPDGGWLLVLPRPVPVRAERAPGAVATSAPDGRLRVWRHGAPQDVDPGALPAVDPAGWVDLDAVPVHVLRAVEPPPPPVPALGSPPPAPRPQLRRIAGITDDPRADRVAQLFAGDRAAPGGVASRRPRGRVRLARLVGSTVVIGGLSTLLVVTTAFEHTFPPLRLVIALAWAISRAADGSEPVAGGGAEPARPARRPRTSPRLQRFLAGPLGVVLRSRHERYLHDLAAAFRQGRFEEALRRSIAIGGAGGRLTVRLPRPRLGPLAPTPVAAPGAGPPLALSATAYLRDLYTQAAAAREGRGRVEEAAFVHADLLGAVTDAVLLLERHDRPRLAAELAQGRWLDPPLVIRLWWRAGERDRALDVARLRGGLRAAADRLADTAPDAALQLRGAWVTELLAAGNVPAAADAAWGAPSLRALVEPALVDASRVGGGPVGARLLAYRVTGRPDPEAVDAAETLLGTPDPDRVPERTAFVSALAELPPAQDAAADRRLASAALRLLVREPALLAAAPRDDASRVVRRLRERAGPLHAADVPPVTVPRARRTGDEPLDVVARHGPGQHRVHDAVCLPGGVLVALGGDGVRLLTPDGRVRARWDVPAERLVVADHGLAALLLVPGDRTVDVHRLDLVSRRVRRWTCLPAVMVAPTFDGAVLPVVDRDGLALLDTTAPGPRTVWRELERGVTVHRLERGARSMSALVQGAPVGVDLRPQLWTWSLPEMVLRSRPRLDLRPGGQSGPTALAVGAGSGVLALYEGAGAPRVEHRLAWGTLAQTLTGSDVVDVTSCGPHLALVRAEPDGQALDLLAPRDAPASTAADDDGSGRRAVVVHLPGAERLSMRHHGDVVTVHDHTGRVLAVDARERRLLLDLTLRP